MYDDKGEDLGDKVRPSRNRRLTEVSWFHEEEKRIDTESPLRGERESLVEVGVLGRSQSEWMFKEGLIKSEETGKSRKTLTVT